MWNRWSYSSLLNASSAGNQTRLADGLTSAFANAAGLTGFRSRVRIGERCTAVARRSVLRLASMPGTSTTRQFGLLIAYVLPGFIGLAGIAPLFPAMAEWLRPIETSDLGLGPPLYAVLAAIAIGKVLSCFRWMLIDRAHRLMGVQRPDLDDRRLEQVLGGFDYLVQSHYRYYEFSANTFLALLGSYSLNRALGTLPFLGPVSDAAVAIVLIVLFFASRDALKTYYTRSSRLIGRSDNDKELASCTTETTTAAIKDNPRPSQRTSPHRSRR